MSEAHAAPSRQREYRRFGLADRLMHGVLMFSFIGLAFTGMPLLFSDAPWAVWLAGVFGGGRSAGILHRVFASMMIGCFVIHVWRLMHRLFVKKELEVLWGPASMTPQPRDVLEMVAHMRWFLRLGPQPRFDHFTYWEKFDYWAVFWGMGIIGGSGLILWLPETFAYVVPGWVFNIAALIHGEEALLAVVFIFTFHFFTGHLRPEKFPMDSVIFTGRVTLKEMEEERPEEFARLTRNGRIDELASPAAPRWVYRLGRTAGGIAVVMGLLMVALILFAVLN